MAKLSAALKRLLKGLDDPNSQDPAGFGREDVSPQLLAVAGQHKSYRELSAYLHGP